MENGQKLVLGVKHATFYDQSTGRTQPFHQIALDLGNMLRVFSVKAEQSGMLDTLSVGSIIEAKDGFIVDKYFVFL